MAQPKLTITLSGYPVHATDTVSLRLDAQTTLQAFSTGVTGALLFFPSNSIHILIEGHADHDIQGAAFEYKTSLDRAINCKNVVENQIRAQAGLAWLDANNLKRVFYSVYGWGTNKTIVDNPLTEADREANRRVDITYILGGHIPLDHISSACRALQLIQNDPENGPTRRLKCLLGKLCSMPDVLDGFPNYLEAHRSIPGSGGWPSMTPNQWHAAINGIMEHVASQVTSAMNDPDPNQQRVGLLTIDDTIGRNINDWYSQQNAGAATGIFDSAMLAFILNMMANNRSILSCYAGYSRRHHND